MSRLSIKTPAGLTQRLIAADRLQQVLKGAPFTPFDAKEIADARDRAFTNRLVTTALRRWGHLNHIIENALTRGLPKRSGSFEAVLRLALTELLFLEKGADHSAIFLAVEAVRRDRKAQHLSKLMNGVLRQAQRDAEKWRALPDAALFPADRLAGWQTAFGDVTENFAAALLAGAPLDLTFKTEDPALVEALGGAPLIGDTVRVANPLASVDALPGYSDGRWWVQDAAAAIPARLMNCATGAQVLDMCAAPGGKTAQMTNMGFAVTALDQDENRLQRLSTNIKRLGYSAELVAGDAMHYRGDTPFDGVLLDAPCTATGTFRRHPEVIWHRTQKDIAARVELQRAMLTNAAASLKPGGMLIYCVCSLETTEGEDQARWIADHLEMLQHDPIMPSEVDGLPAAVTPAGFVRTHPQLSLPGAVSGALDGFFVARYRRR